MSAGRPVFVVNADDLGMTRGTTDGIMRAHRDGVVTSASLIVTTPAVDHAVAAVRDAPGLGVGLHFSLSAGRSVLPPEGIPDLVDGDGRFRARFTSLLVGLRGARRDRVLRQIAAELDAQLARFDSFGLVADHLDGERHVHLVPGVFELVAAAAAARGIRFVRRIDDVGAAYVGRRGLVAMLASGGPVKYLLLRALTRRSRSAARARGLAATRYATLLYTGRMDLVLPRLFARPPAGVTEIAVHPGLPAGEDAAGVANDALASYLRSDDRRRELDACIAARAAADGVRLATFAELAGEAG